MKLSKVGFLAALMVGFVLPSYAQEDQAVHLLPTMSSQSTVANQAWVGAFQLVWNDATDTLGQIVQAPDKSQTVVEELNEKSFTSKELSESAYYNKHGRNTPKLKQTIETGIQEKFGEGSQILGNLEWDGSGYVFYSMLKKDFEFEQEFDDMGKDDFGKQGVEVEYFGATKLPLMKTVYPLFYNTKQDFAVRLQSKQNDEVYLFRTEEEGTLQELYNLMQEKMATWKDGHNIDKGDTFKAPKIHFETERNFEEVEGVKFQSGDIITSALENLKFNMDKAGVEVKAEAVMSLTRGIVMNWHFDFTGRYVIFIQEQGKKPYFALLVEDPTKLQ